MKMQVIVVTKSLLLLTVLSLFLTSVTLGQTTLADDDQTELDDDVDGTATTPGQPETTTTTQDPSTRLACGSCLSVTIDECVNSGIIGCSSEETCYIDVSFVNGTTYVTAGCTGDVQRCESGSLDECLENQTSCFLCCNYQWCNQDIRDKFKTTPVPPAPVSTPPVTTPPSTTEQAETTTEPGLPPMCYSCTPATAQDCSENMEEVNGGCPVGSSCFVNITWSDGESESYSMGCTLDTKECFFNASSIADCPDNATSCLLCCDDSEDNDYCNADLITKLLPSTAGTASPTAEQETTAAAATETIYQTPEIDTTPGPAAPETAAQTPEIDTTPAPAAPEATDQTSEQVSTPEPLAETVPIESTPIAVQETTAIPDIGTTPVPVEPESRPATTAAAPTVAPENTATQSKTTPESSEPLECYQCTDGSRDDCINGWPLFCDAGSICFLNITSVGDPWNETFSMGCTPDNGECSIYNRTSEVSCPENDTNCLLCCDWKRCNVGLIGKLTPSTAPPTPAPTPPATPEPSTEEPTPEASEPATPATESPTTPTSNTPTPESQTTEEPSIPTSIIQTPVPDSPTTETPTITTPATESPTTEAQPTETPATESPTTQAQPTETPATESPTTQAQPTETPASESTITQAQPTETPASESTTTQAQPTESPATESPTTQTQPTETPASDVSAITTESPTAVIIDTTSPPSEADTTPIPPSDSPSTPAVIHTETPQTSGSTTELISTLTPSTTPSPTAGSTIAATAAPSTVPPTGRTTPLNCYECTDDEPWKFCNISANIERCTEVDDVCGWSVTKDDGSFESTKGCIKREECEALSGSNNDSCSDFVTVTGECNWCCDDADLCNYDRGDYSVPDATTTTTESPPSVADTTPIPPSDSPSTPAVVDTETPQTSGSTTELSSTLAHSPSASQTAGSTIASTVTPSTVPPTERTTPLRCYQCIDDEPWKFCNISANIEHCTDVDDVCRWSVTNDDGSFESTKGCVKREECEALSESNNDSCSDYVTVKGECNWCCEDADLCNYDRGDYSVTPPTAVSTTTTASTPGYCDMSICLFQFQLLVAQASKEPDLFFNEFCRSVPLVFTCLANTSEACGYCDGGQRDLIEVILANMTAQCPIPCDAVAGYDCTINYYYEIIELISQGGRCREILEIVVISEKCRVRTVGSCDSDIRDNIDFSYTAIKTEVEVFCNATQPVFPPHNGTESPSCNVTNCLKCITDLGDIILHYFNKTDGDIFQMCGAIQVHYDCYWRYAAECSDGTRYSLEAAWNFTIGLIWEQCANKICDTTKARTCIVDLMTLIETKKDIQGACRNIQGTIDCVLNNTAGCELDEQESLNRTLQYTLDLIGDQCKDNVQVTVNDTIEICEGGGPAVIRFVFLSSPEAICGDQPNCKCYIDVEIEQGNFPKCRNGDIIRQAVVVRSPGSSTGTISEGGSHCSMEIAEDWDQEHNISIAAKVDFKYDGTQRRLVKVWYRKTVNGVTVERRNIANTTLIICDKDRKDSMCSVVNDPHIKTFDGWYYNNFMEGFFIVYIHSFLPYEVQIATQRCNSQASCTCAVAVRAGDTVLYIDKCRKKGFAEKWCPGKGKYVCDNVMKIHLYGHDRMTPGMRVFSQNNGKIYYVWFPHGQTCKIAIDGKYLNVWMTPSPYDIGNVGGLCGNYDGNSTNDLMYRNQSLYLGEGYNKMRGQPKGFCKHWEASLIENIYAGVAKNPYVPDIYCECDGYPKNSSVISNCHYNALVETCDMERGNVEILPPFEFTDSEVDNKPGKGNNNGNNNGNRNNRRRRQAEAQNPLDTYDIDAAFDPPNVTDDQGAIDAATQLCEEYFNSISVAKQCQTGSADGGAVANFNTSIAGCVDDILATNSTEYMTAALEALKAQCTAELAQNPVLANSPIAADILAASCLNQCSGQGTCENGTCTCNTGYTGLDCGFSLTAQPQYVQIYNNLCDVTKDDCSSAQITGAGFIPNTTTCWVQLAKVTENGVEGIGEFEPASLKFVSPDEVHCQLRNKSSAIVQVENSGTRSNSSTILVYDPTCWTCVDLPTENCTRVINSCIIDGGCYGPGQENPADKCKICRPKTSDSTWTHNSDSESCSSDDNIPLIVGLCVGLGGGLILIAIIVIVVVYKMRCADSKELMTTEEYETMSRGSVHRSSDFAYDNIYQSTPDSDVAGSVRGGKFRYRDPPPDYQAKGETNETFSM